MNKTLAASVIASSVLLLLGIYFFVWRGGSDLESRRDDLEYDLSVVKTKLNKEKGKLDAMTAELGNSYPLALEMQNEMKAAAALATQTNFLFVGANGENPTLLIKNLLELDINGERQDINIILSQWQKKLALSAVGKLTIAEAEAIRIQMELIKKYLDDINTLVNALTTENSGLSQKQIDTYLAKIPSPNSIDEVIVSLDNTIVAYSPEEDLSSSPSFTPIVDENAVETSNTLAEALIQETIVTQTEIEVEQIEQELAEVNQEIAEASLPYPTPYGTPAPYATPPAEPVVYPTPDVNTGGYTNTAKPNFKGIIIQPGPPRLIEAENQY